MNRTNDRLLGSYFTPLAQEFEKHVQRTPGKTHSLLQASRRIMLTTMGSDTTDRYEYAGKVVRESLKSKPTAWFWYGKATTIVWFINTFCGLTLWVCLQPYTTTLGTGY